MRIYDRYGYFVIPRTIDQLQFDILKHTLVPKHSVMSSEEVDHLLRRIHANLSQLPIISRFDPVSKAICVRPEQVCEIVRSSNNAIQSLYYRVCKNIEFKKIKI